MNDPSWHHLQQKDQLPSSSLPEFLTHRIVNRVNGCRFNQLSLNVVYCAAVGNYNRLLQCSVISGLNRNHHLDDDSYPFRHCRNGTISSLSEEQWRENSETMTQGVCLFKGNSFSIWFSRALCHKGDTGFIIRAAHMIKLMFLYSSSSTTPPSPHRHHHHWQQQKSLLEAYSASMTYVHKIIQIKEHFQ